MKKGIYICIHISIYTNPPTGGTARRLVQYGPRASQILGGVPPPVPPGVPPPVAKPRWSKGPCGTTFCYSQSDIYDIGTKILLLQ